MGKQNETRGNERNMQNVSYAISYRHFFISSSDWQNVERFGGEENKEKSSHILLSAIVRRLSSSCRASFDWVEWMALLTEMTLSTSLLSPL